MASSGRGTALSADLGTAASVSGATLATPSSEDIGHHKVGIVIECVDI